MTRQTGFKSPPRNHSNNQHFQQVNGGFAAGATSGPVVRNRRNPAQIVSALRPFVGPIVGTR